MLYVRIIIFILKNKHNIKKLLDKENIIKIKVYNNITINKIIFF